MSRVPYTIEAPVGWSEADADDVSNDDVSGSSILTHETGAQIAVSEEGNVRFYFPSGRMSLFNSPDCM
jgi:hypothetical protein